MFLILSAGALPHQPSFGRRVLDQDQPRSGFPSLMRLGISLESRPRPLPDQNGRRLRISRTGCRVPGAWTLAQASTAAKTMKAETTAAETRIDSTGIATSIEARPNIVAPGKSSLTSIKNKSAQRPGCAAKTQAADSASARAASIRLMPPVTIRMMPSRSSLVKVRLTVSMVSPR